MSCSCWEMFKRRKRRKGVAQHRLKVVAPERMKTNTTKTNCKREEQRTMQGGIRKSDDRGRDSEGECERRTENE